MDSQPNRRVEDARHALAVVTVLVTILYLAWRYTVTFNPEARLFTGALFGAELFGFVTTVLFYFTVWRPRRRTAPPALPGRTVDVLVPTWDEPVPVLRTTLLACNDLRYPHRTLVLDDGRRPEVEALSRELGCIWLARGTGGHARAGNLDFGLRHSTAEFVALLDADHVPLPHFVDQLIGSFADARVGFVQAAQESCDIGSIRHRTGRKGRSPWGERDLFFSVIQPGQDAWGAAMFAGSCALLRRQALDDVGGFATGSIAEDLLTSIRLHAAGWSSVHHREPLAYGSAARTQRPCSIRRWGTGNWQVFFRANPLFLKGLTLPQRLCYLASTISPLEGLQKLVFYLTPPIALVTGVLPVRALDVDFLLHFVPYFLLSAFALDEMARGVGGPVLLEQHRMAKYFTDLTTVVAPLVSRRARASEVTSGVEQVRGPSRLILPQLTVLVVSLAAIAWSLVELLLERRGDSLAVAVSCSWALYNGGLALAVVQRDSRAHLQRRSELRIPCIFPVVYRVRGDGVTERLAVAEDLAEGGVSLLAVGRLPMGGDVDVSLVLPRETVRLACRPVRERSVDLGRFTVSRVGLRFVGVDQGTRDRLARYLHEAAISRFMKEHVLGGRTCLERRLGGHGPEARRARRALAHLPVAVRGQLDPHYAVVKDLSDTGYLLATARVWLPGEELTIEVVLGKERVALSGRVVRSQTQPVEDYPEYLSGVRLAEGSAGAAHLLSGVAGRMEAFVQGERADGRAPAPM